MLSFFVAGTPQGKGRARAARIGKGVRMYTPDKTAKYEHQIAWAAKLAHAVMLDGPVGLRVTILCAIPKYFTKAKREAALIGPLYPTGRPDADNVAKAVQDALNHICYADDAQIVDLHATKRYATAPGVQIEVWRISPHTD